MNRNDDLLNQALKTEQAGCRKDDTQCCGKCVKPTYEQLAAQLKQSQIDAECYKRGMDASNKLIADVVAENAALKGYISERCYIVDPKADLTANADIPAEDFQPQTPATDRFLAEQQYSALKSYAESISQRMKNKDLSMREKDRLNFAWAEVKARMADIHNAQLRNEVKV